MDNIIKANIRSQSTFTRSVWQYDYGQILQITGAELPPAVEVQFALAEKSGETITRVATTTDGVTEVQIPNELLKRDECMGDYYIYAFIYVTDEKSGNTKYKIAIMVNKRPKPEEPTDEPEQEENLFHATVVAVNAAAERAETAEKNAKESAEEATRQAELAKESAETAQSTKQEALEGIAEKKQEVLSTIEEQEESSVEKITEHTTEEIRRMQTQVAESKEELEQTIGDASTAKSALDGSVNVAGESKSNLDKSTKLAGSAKEELDTSTQKASSAKTALDGSVKTATDKQTALDTTVKQANTLDTSLREQITTGTQLQKDIVASGEKSVQDIQNAGSEQLDKMQTVAEEFAADREQIKTNKENIGNLKEEMSKNFLDDAKTKRSLDALWKLNQGISYQFETDAERAYQKDIPSGAKLASVKKIGGRTIVWNQLFNYKNIKTETVEGVTFTNNGDGTYTADGTSTGIAYISKDIKFVKSHMYYMRSLTTIGTFTTYKAYITGNSIFNNMTDYGYGAIETALKDGVGYFVPLFVSKGTTVENLKIIPQIYDLTKMFGAGNEPATPEEFEAMFPEGYYSYNGGTLMSMQVNEVVERGRNLIDDSTFVKSYTRGEFSKLKFLDTSLLDNGTYTLSVDMKVSGNTNVAYIVSRKDGSIVDKGNNVINGKRACGTLTFTVDDKIDGIYGTYGTGAGTIEIFGVQLEKGSVSTAYSPYHKNTYSIPQAILDLDGYGDGVSDDIYNYVDWENKKYHKRVGRVDLGSLSWKTYQTENAVLFVTVNIKNTIKASICSDYIKKTVHSIGKEDKFYYFNPANMVIVDSSYSDIDAFKAGIQGVMFYYSLDEEQITDISDIIDGTFQEPIEVETGGTLTFRNSNGDGYRLPIPSEEEYIISLAEVGGGTSE